MPDFFVPNPAGMQHVFHSWTGPLGQHIERKSRILQIKAKATAPKDSGALAARIEVDLGKHGNELESKIGTGTHGGARGYAYWQHEGTKPHTIEAVHGKALRFMMNGMVVFRTKVRHPGFPATHFLTRWLRDTVR